MGQYGSTIELAADIRQPIAISDGKNGIAVAWTNYGITGFNYQLRMNRLNHNGLLQFTAGSEKINTIEGIGYGPFFRLILSKKKNYIIVWTSDAFSTTKVFSQKVDPLGNFLWGSSEIKVRDTTSESDYPDILSDGTDGAYYVWLDARKVNVALGIFVQHVTSLGIIKWKSQGLQIDSSAGYNSPHIAPDVNNGMKIFWTSQPANRVYMQQLNKNGIAQLPGIGVAVGATGHTPTYYQQVLPASNNHDIIFLQYASPATCYAKYVPFSTVLPLTLLNFNAENNGTKNIISWQTTSEINASYFSVERSKDGVNFYEIATQKSNNAPSINNYSYTDAANSNADVYYRLKMMDANGSFTYSKIVNLHQNNNASFKIIPNPVAANCTIYFNAVPETNSVLKIFDRNGNLQKQILLAPKQTQLSFNVSNLSPGTYFCSIESAGQTLTQKLIVIK